MINETIFRMEPFPFRIKPVNKLIDLHIVLTSASEKYRNHIFLRSIALSISTECSTDKHDG